MQCLRSGIRGFLNDGAPEASEPGVSRMSFSMVWAVSIDGRRRSKLFCLNERGSGIICLVTCKKDDSAKDPAGDIPNYFVFNPSVSSI
jgi:hypothetical protein